MLLNNYFVCLAGQVDPLAFDPFSYCETDFPGFIEINYLAGALRELEHQATVKGQTIYITWDTRKLPSYGQRVVAILMGDEWCRFPQYLGQVTAIFRSHHNWPMYTGIPKTGVTYRNFIALVQYIRLHVLGLQGRLQYLLLSLKPEHIPTRSFIIPLGYANQADLPIRPMSERTIDLSFMGSVDNFPPPKTSLKYWLNSPKHASRSEMIDHVKSFQQAHPSIRTYLQGSDQFAGNLLGLGREIEEEKMRYSNLLMESKIALVPRGSSLETFRLFEAMRYGCVAICENLPRRWYYRGLPALELDSWGNLGSVVLDLLKDPARLETLHQRALEYWHSVCSEEALGKYLAEKLAAVGDLTVAANPVHVPDSQRPGSGE